MRMDEMVEILENAGFSVNKRYSSVRHEYTFTIKKNDIFYEGIFIYPDITDHREIDRRQRNFLTNLMHDYEKYAEYVRNDVSMTRNLLDKQFNVPRKIPDIKKVIFNPPATVVLWKDGTKTVVKAQNEDFDPEKGLAMAISKKALGNKGNYCNEIKKWTEPFIEEQREIESFLEMFRFKKPDPVQQAYDALKEVQNKQKTTKGGLFVAIDEAIGYLGEALDN